MGQSPSAVIEARIDIRILADILRHFRTQQAPPRTKSELVRMALGDFHKALMMAGLITDPISSVTEAVAEFEAQRLNVFSDGRRGIRSIAKALADEDVAETEVFPVKNGKFNLEDAMAALQAQREHMEVVDERKMK